MIKNLYIALIAATLSAGSAAIAADAPPMTAADMHKIAHCKALKPEVMVANSTCIKMHSLHPEALPFDNENSH